MAVPQIACHAVWGYLVLVVTYLDYVTSQTPPTCQDPFTNTHDVIFLLDVSMEIPNDTFSDYESYVEELIEKHIPEVNDTKRYACISFNENNSDVIIDNLSGPKSGSNSTEVKDLRDKIQNGLMAASNSTQIGIIKATQTALDIVSAIQNSSGLQDVTSIYQGTSTPVTDSANQNATEPENWSTNQNMRKSVIIFYVTTGNFDDEVIGNVTLLLEEIETRVSGMLTVYGIGVGNFTKSDLETLVRAGNNTCRVKSLQEWRSYPSSRANTTVIPSCSNHNTRFVVLLVIFVITNTTVAILFIVACIQAARHQAGPKSGRNNAGSASNNQPSIQMDFINRPLPSTPPGGVINPGTDRPPPASNSVTTQRSLPSVPTARELPPLPESSPETRLKTLDAPIQERANTRYSRLPGTSRDGRNSPALPRERPSVATQRSLPSVPTARELPPLPESSPETRLKTLDAPIQERANTRYSRLPGTSRDGRNSPALPRERPSDVADMPLPTVPDSNLWHSPLESASGTLPIGRNSPIPQTKPIPADRRAPPMHPPRFPIGQKPTDLSRYLPMPKQNSANQAQALGGKSNEPYYVNVRRGNSNYFQLMRDDAKNKLDKAKRVSRRILSIFAE